MPLNCLLAGKEVQKEGQTGCQRDQDSGYRWQRTRRRYTIISHIIEIIVLILCYLVMKDSEIYLYNVLFFFLERHYYVCLSAVTPLECGFG